MANDYIPRGDAEFNVWQANFVAYASANLANLGLALPDLLPITSGQTAWAAGLTAHVAAQAAAQSARVTKDGSRTMLEAPIRALVRRLQANPSVSDAERAGLGITVPESGMAAAGMPVSRPLCRIDTSQRLRHTIDFTDEYTPTRRAKPAGAMGAEIWIKIGPTPPVDPSELTFLAVDTRSPYTVDFDGADGGKQAHYMVRWVNTRGETGPWSETVSATIGA